MAEAECVRGRETETERERQCDRETETERQKMIMKETERMIGTRIVRAGAMERGGSLIEKKQA